MPRFASRIRPWIAVLLIAALTVVPVLDALACGADALHAVETAGDAAKDPAKTGIGEHAIGLCGHNHCHHFGNNVLPAVAGVPDYKKPPRVIGAVPPALALSNAGDGLMRPPRV